MDQPYSNRELDMKFEKLTDLIDENHRETMDRIDLLDRKNNDKHLENTNRLQKIEEQTVKTNGSVRGLLAFRVGLYMCGVLIVIVVLPLIIYIFTTLSHEIVQNQKDIKLLQLK